MHNISSKAKLTGYVLVLFFAMSCLGCGGNKEDKIPSLKNELQKLGGVVPR